jgi:hypothetical protein
MAGERAATAVLVVSGLPLALKGAPPVPGV